MQRNCPTYMIDAGGVLLLSGLLGACAWLMLVSGDRTRTELADMRQAATAAEQDLATLETVRDRQRAQLVERRQELTTRGHLPGSLPVEQYFRSLAGLAGGNRLHVVRHQPLSVRSYPGLRESRYAYEVSGDFPDLVRFLHAVEQADFWADISHFRLHGAETPAGTAGINRAMPGGAPAPKTALLTVSVFSAAHEQKKPESSRG